MVYYLLVIGLITLAFWILYKAKALLICPICAAVVITWMGGIIALYSRAAWADPLIIAILMGASLGALVDKYGSRLGLWPKTALVLLGLPAIYFLVQRSLLFGIGLMALMIVAGITLTQSGKQPAESREKDLFKDCC